eukprot:CAMPEP_0197867990 /NCGR_PEP_ID=MMETSP1438-20131217/45050_1 /TAXON_ID=1461541 /ORGANISM="Pterosperma sp., Strain CCMP1384" /LENGTH=47 /DNA_ID= /DNA_START= /DNA_END= /DNA_ORIENTATION=
MSAGLVIHEALATFIVPLHRLGFHVLKLLSLLVASLAEVLAHVYPVV